MKRLLFIIFSLCLISSAAISADQIDATEIIRMIDAGQMVEFKNMTIRGHLDFTKIKDITEEKSGKHDRQTKYYCHVRIPITFINCKFQGDVIAYVSKQHPNELYTPFFYENVLFDGCQVNGDFLFKYVHFKEAANFPNTVFKQEINFKYTKFSERADYSHAAFEDEVTFKYTQFPEYVDFSHALFEEETCFKYTKFPEGVSFKNAVFEDDADFKYAKMDAPVDLDGVQFKGGTNFKYTKVNGKSITLHLLEK